MEHSAINALSQDVNARLSYLISLQHDNQPEAEQDNLANLAVNVEFNNASETIQLRTIPEETKEIFRRGSCVLLAYALHEITGLPLVLFHHPRTFGGNRWEGHAAIQVKPGVVLDIGGVITNQKMLQDFDEEYGITLKPKAHIMKPEKFLRTVMGFLGPVHPSIEATELEWLVVEDFAKHLIRTSLIPYYEEHNSQLATEMLERLKAKETTEAKDPAVEIPAHYPKNLAIYSKSAGMKWQDSPNERLKELVIKSQAEEKAALPEGLPESFLRTLKQSNDMRVTVHFRYLTEIMLGRIDENVIRVMSQEGGPMLALALHDLLGLPLAGVTVTRKKQTWLRNAGVETSDGMFLDIFGITSQKNAKPFLRIGPKPWKTFERDEFIALVAGENAPPEFPLNRIGELEWLVVQEYAKTLAQSILLPHYREHAPEAVCALEERLQAWDMVAAL